MLIMLIADLQKTTPLKYILYTQFPIMRDIVSGSEAFG